MIEVNMNSRKLLMVWEVVRAMTGCTEAEADRFRKGLTKHAKRGTLAEAREEFVRKARAHRPEARPEALYRLWEQIEGWGGYGFTEGHAASFALTGYRTGYLSVHHPAAYFAGLMNHHPMGYLALIRNSLLICARDRSP